MIIYATKQTFERYKLKLLEWGTKRTDKSAIATLNTTQSRFADGGYRFYKFVRDGILHTMEINHAVNFKWLFIMEIDGKTEYIYAGEKFREIVLERYGELDEKVVVAEFEISGYAGWQNSSGEESICKYSKRLWIGGLPCLKRKMK